MISMARTFGAPDTVPAGRVARSTSMAEQPVAQPPRHLRGEVHHVAVALERHHLVDRLGAEVHDPAHVVAGQVDQHDVLGLLLGVLAQLGAEAAVLLVGAAPSAGAGDGPGDDGAVEQLHHRLGRRPDEGEARAGARSTCTGSGSPGGAPGTGRRARPRGRGRSAAPGPPGTRRRPGCAPWPPRRRGRRPRGPSWSAPRAARRRRRGAPPAARRAGRVPSVGELVEADQRRVVAGGRAPRRRGRVRPGRCR